MNAHELTSQLKARVEALVKRGDNVRAETAHLVEQATGTFVQAKDGLTSLVKAVAEGAVEGARGTMPENAENKLRQVIEGVTDGLTKSAQAVRLTLEESAASGTRFAKEDLARIGHEFRATGEGIVDIMSHTASALGDHAKAQAHQLGEHARQTLLGIWPPLDSALHAAAADPLKLGHDTLHAATAAARQAAGVFFTRLGEALKVE